MTHPITEQVDRNERELVHKQKETTKIAQTRTIDDVIGLAQQDKSERMADK